MTSENAFLSPRASSEGQNPHIYRYKQTETPVGVETDVFECVCVC